AGRRPRAARAPAPTPATGSRAADRMSAAMAVLPNDRRAAAAAPALTRRALYLFVLSIPFELPDLPLPFDLPTMTACILIGAALLQPLRCFARIPLALVPFTAFLLAYVARFALGTGDHAAEVARLVALMMQCLLVFWVCYNLFRDPRVVRGALIALVVAAAARALLQLTGVAANVVEATSA